MRFITPRERLKINSMEDAERVKALPSVVVIQRTRENGQEDEKVYLIEKGKWEEYLSIAGSDQFTPVEVKERAAKKLGYPIELKDFENSTACELSCMHSPDGKSAYSIYATKFKGKPRKINSESVD